MLFKKENKDKIFFNGKKECMLLYEIQVKNLKLINIDIIVKDQLFVMINVDIEIESVNVFKVNYNEIIGILNWEFLFKVYEVRMINFSFKVWYDKEKQVVL